MGRIKNTAMSTISNKLVARVGREQSDFVDCDENLT